MVPIGLCAPLEATQVFPVLVKATGLVLRYVNLLGELFPVS